MAGARASLWVTCMAAWLMLAGAATWCLGTDAPPSRQSEVNVVDVRVVGNRATSLSKIHGVLSTRAGRPFDQGALENDVRKLASKGWFLDVKTVREEVAGGLIVTFQVVERPTLEYVKYLGNEQFRTSVLAKQSEIKRGDALDPYAVDTPVT